MDYLGRQAKLAERLRDADVEALIVTSTASQHYLCGFRGEGLLLAGPTCVIVTDGRYQAEGDASAATLVINDQGHLTGLGDATREAGYRRVGFDSDHTTVAALDRLTSILPSVELVPLQKTVENMRAVKAEDEIDLMRKAASITDVALAGLLAGDLDDLTEALAALDLHRKMLDLGAEGPAFDLIVGMGPGAAEPHHRSADAPLQGPGPLLFDLGARVEGYCSDMTRTVHLGPPDDRFRKAYVAVYDAQVRAVEAVRPGMVARDLYKVARDSLETAGMAEFFCHGLGHGVGLEIHELPGIGPAREEVVEVNQVITIEPGVYFPGWGGVRVEDTVVVREDGAEPLTLAPKLNPADV
jgi:Xaa-Pro aminopeptidase